MKDETIIAVVAIIAIVVLEMFALYQKVDGQVLSLVIGAIAGIAGYEIKAKVNESKGTIRAP